MAGNIRAFAQQLNANSLLHTQSYQNSEKIPLMDSVPAGQRKLCRAGVSNYGDFLCLFITGTFETLKSVTYEEVDYVVDDGIDYLRGQLRDSTGQRALFTDFIPLTLWVSPGRRRSSLAANNLLDVANVGNQASPGNTLFYPQEFEYIWAANAEILLDVYNDSNTEIHFELCFHGIRLLSDTAVSGVARLRSQG
jgi:hypothetical protein